MLEVIMKKINKEDKIVCTSLDVADTFEKSHKEIIYAIDGQKNNEGKTKHLGLIEQLEQSGELHIANYFMSSRLYKRLA